MAPTNADLVALARQRLYPNYKPAPLALVRGKGCELFDADGRRWLDLCAGVAVCSVGHAHPTLVRAIAEQAAAVMHVSNYFYNEPNIRLADELCRRTGFARAFFCNSGTEANEAMLKLARHHFYAAGQKERVRVVAFDNAFHGRTLGALSMTGTPKYREGFGPLGPVTHVPYGDAAAVEAAMGKRRVRHHRGAAAGRGGRAAGAGGVPREAPRDRRRARRAPAGRRGADGRRPARALPRRARARVRSRTRSRSPRASAAASRSARCSRPRRWPARCPPGTHGSTFGGNPLACAAALAVLRVLDEEKLVEGRAREGRGAGADARRARARAAGHVRGLRAARGCSGGSCSSRGFVARDVLPHVQEAGVLLTAAGERVLRFSPPLVVSVAELEEGVRALRSALAALRLKSAG